MKKIKIEFQDKNSTEFKVDAQGLTYRELLVLARGLPEFIEPGHLQDENQKPAIKIEFTGKMPFGFNASTQGGIEIWQLELVADEFYLAAQHIFFTQQNQAMVQAARNQQAVMSASAALRRKDSGLIIPGGRG